MQVLSSGGAMPDNDSPRTTTTNESTRRHPRGRKFFAPCALLAAVCLLAVPAWPEDNCTTPPQGPPNQGYAIGQPSGGQNLFANFANSGGSPNLMYEIPLSPGNGQVAAGDLNSTYFEFYYSITNLTNWLTANHYCTGVELVIVGAFPDARYLAVTSNDMHYANTQHLADSQLDPAASNTVVSYETNPFVLQNNGQSLPYTGVQDYLIPISLGFVPDPTGSVQGGCGISPFEGDNLIDATQRHPFLDWNTNVVAPDVNSGDGLTNHRVDVPGHTVPSSQSGGNGSNLAGSIIVRNYLAPPLDCQPSDNSFTCQQSTPPATPYLIVRDTYTGCAYYASWAETNGLVYINPPGTTPPTCPGTSAACTAVVSNVDVSSASTGNTWLDKGQQNQHVVVAQTTPQSCWANGASVNKVAWTRSPEYEGVPGPEDAYIGGAVSSTDLGTISSNPDGSGTVMWFQFQLPNTANTPCKASGGSYTCNLTDSAQLRYMSLTFFQSGSATEAYIADPDGTLPTTSALSFVSLADNAFCPVSDGHNPPNYYANLIVNVAGTLPPWLRQSAGTGVAKGVSPVLLGTAQGVGLYTVWCVNGYTVLNLANFQAQYGLPANGLLNTSGTGPNTYLVPVFDTSKPLLLTMRTTLPGDGFVCSGQAVPFSTAEYTSVGGLMGPYAPLISYMAPPTQGQMADVPPNLPGISGVCGVLPTSEGNTSPDANSPTLAAPWKFPEQYWPGSSSGTALSCGATTTSTTQIYFVATQFSSPLDDQSQYPNGKTGCNTIDPPNSCSQLIFQAAQSTELPNSMGTWQPPLPVRIVGQGFGYLPNTTLPLAVQGSSFTNLDIQNDGGSLNLKHPGWDSSTASDCQLYIATWSDTGISVMVELQMNVQDQYQINNGFTADFLSPVNDVNWLSFQPIAQNNLTPSECPLAAKDHLTFTVTNPQTNGSFMIQNVLVRPTGSQQLF